MMTGVCVTSEEGVAQGGPLSPLLDNIMLDDLDNELTKRGASSRTWTNGYVGECECVC